jgi:ferredoxin
MSSVVTYTLSRCVKCMKCVKACPSGALTMENSRINIRHDRCLNCGRCITACHNQGLLAKGQHAG